MNTISGYVYDALGAPLSRLVRAYRRYSGEMAGEAVSDAVTGAYAISVSTPDEHYVVLIDSVYTIDNPHWDETVLALHMDGLHGSTDFIDEKGKTLTISGTPYLSTDQAKFGATAAFFNGSSRVITPVSADFAFGVSDFTIEMWVYFLSGGAGTKYFLGTYTSGKYFYCGYTYSSSVLFFAGSSFSDVNATGTTADAWHHFALSRVAGSIKLFVDGVQKGSVDVSTSYDTRSVHIGGTPAEIASGAMVGFIDDVRITKGIGRYTANFTPPTAPFGSAFEVVGGNKNALIYDHVTPAA